MTKSKFASEVFKITEREFREEIRDLCKLFGWKFWFCWTSIHSPKGYPDLTLCRPPRLILAELKNETNKPTPNQEEWAALLLACPSVEYYLWRPNDLENIIDILR